MKTYSVLFFVTLVTGAAVNLDNNLPPSLKICSLNDPNRDRCIKELIQAFLPLLRKRTPNFNFPIMDPYTPPFSMFTFGNAAVGYHCVANLTDMRHYGMSRTKIRSVKSKFTEDGMILKAEVFIGQLFNNGNYSLVFSSSFFNLKSQGNYNFTLKNMNAKWIIKGKLEKVRGEDYMKIYEFNIDPEVSDFAINFSDKLINHTADNVINQYWRLFYKEVFELTYSQWQPWLLDPINQIFAEIPFRRLLKKD